MRAARALPAGVVDAGVASLATFAVSVYAVHALSAAELGTYALFFSGVILASAVSTHLVFSPASVDAVAWPQAARAQLLRQVPRLSGPIALCASVAATSAAWAAAVRTHEGGPLLPLTLTAVLCGLLSPLQDQVRSTLHLAGLSWRAAAVSTIHLFVVSASLTLSSVLDIDEQWRPLGALAAGNAISLGIALSSRREWAHGLPRYTLRELLPVGRWLLALELCAAGALFLAAVIISQLAGPAALGHAEAARVVAHPIFVLTIGLSAVLGPRSMEAGRARDSLRADRIARSFECALVSAAAAWCLVVVMPGPGDALAAILPAAFVKPGLVPLTILASVPVGLAYPYRSELLGAGEARRLLPAALLAASACVGVCTAASWMGPYARPAAWTVFGLTLAAAYRRRRALLYVTPA